ncbi:alanine and proline-rich secreted protein Apa [Nocardia yamanashiensis]|uniref:alanine and proline-rich secreted protein Apa n=1 Tax=Nocardia yamanashiensis TaxID=209247 RepID=UPI001E2ACCF8|nr:alanine and proline-rich secreted protein Apa [Nocardia yamanashiensis]UGT41540.1 alanine and proline-rich secreted protein Apa [Nocardia yamanashiensis]
MNANPGPAAVSPQTARWVVVACVLMLVIGLGGVGCLVFRSVRPSADEAARIDSAAAGMSFVPPEGWEQNPRGNDHLIFGQVALRQSGSGSGSGMILLGKLDRTLFAAAESDDGAAACGLAGGMGAFFFPSSGEQVDTSCAEVKGRAVQGRSCFHRIVFNGSSNPPAEVYGAVVRRGVYRWWVTWLGDATAPVDREAAARLAKSIRPL